MSEKINTTGLLNAISSELKFNFVVKFSGGEQ